MSKPNYTISKDGEDLVVSLNGMSEKDVIINYLRMIQEDPLTLDELQEELSDDEIEACKTNAKLLFELAEQLPKNA